MTWSIVEEIGGNCSGGEIIDQDDTGYPIVRLENVEEECCWLTPTCCIQGRFMVGELLPRRELRAWSDRAQTNMLWISSDFLLDFLSKYRVSEHLDPEESEIKLDKALWPLPLVPLSRQLKQILIHKHQNLITRNSRGNRYPNLTNQFERECLPNSPLLRTCISRDSKCSFRVRKALQLPKTLETVRQR